MYRHIPRKSRYVTIGTPSGPPPTPSVGIIAFSTTNPTLAIQEDGTGVALIKLIHVSGGPFTSFALSAPTYLGATSGWCVPTFDFINGERHVRLDVSAAGMNQDDAESMTIDVIVGNASPATTTLTLTLAVQNDPTNDGVLTLTPGGITTFSATQNTTNYPSAVITLSSSGEEAPQAPDLTTVNYLGGPTGWLSVGPIQPNGNGTYSIPIAVNDLTIAVGSWQATVDVSDSFLPGTATITVQLTVNAASIPITISVSPPSLAFTGTVGGGDPQPKVLTITRAGTGTLTAPTISEPSALSWLTESVASGTDPQWDVVVTPDVTGLAAGTHTGTVRVSHASATNSPVDVSVTFTVAAAPSGSFTAPPHAPPVGMPWNATTNRFDNHPLQTRYADNEIAAPDWIDIDTTPHPTSGLVSSSLTDNTSTNANMALLNSWISYHNTQGVRKGYESASGRIYRGRITTPHNTASGWSGIRTKGVTYDENKTSVRRVADGGMVLMASTNDQSVFRTSVTGAANGDHGRWALIGLRITADPATCGRTQGSPFHSGLIQFGSTATDQDAINKMPVGLLVSDCWVGGVTGQYFRRGIQMEGLDMEIHATLIDEIHNSTNYGADNGISQDAQCITAWNGGSRAWVRYSILHGGDEGYNSGGSNAVIPDVELTDWFFDHCEFSASEHYCFGTANTVPSGGPYDKLTPHASGSGYAFWQKKNLYEMKRGHRFLIQFCRLSGIRAPNNNQGYAVTIKTQPYGNFHPLQSVRDVMFHGCWVERCPAGFVVIANQPNPPSPAGGGGGIGEENTARVSMTDTFMWNVNVAPYNQGSRRLLLALNDADDPCDGVYVNHVTCATTATSTDGAVWGAAANMAPNLVVKNSILPRVGQGIWSSAPTLFGNNAIVSLGGTATNLTVCPTTPGSGAITGYPANTTSAATFAALGMVDQVAGNLRLDPASTLYAGNADDADDGLNRGVSDPDLVMAEIALVPTVLTAADYTPVFG